MDEIIEHEIIEKIKDRILEYVNDDNLLQYFDRNIRVEVIDKDEFLRLSHTNDLSSAPAAFHNSNNNTVYLLKDYSPRLKQIHNFIHELLHEYSNNYKNYGKCGLNVYGYDENNKLISVGGVINEAATEFLTSIINNDGFIGYNDYMKYIFEIFIDIINIRKDFIGMYFQKENWISDEMNKKFNSSKPYQLDEFIVELDNRLPMYRKKPYNFNKVFAILIDAVFDKLKKM